jgi:hypothetical protein
MIQCPEEARDGSTLLTAHFGWLFLVQLVDSGRKIWEFSVNFEKKCSFLSNQLKSGQLSRLIRPES